MVFREISKNFTLEIIRLYRTLLRILNINEFLICCNHFGDFVIPNAINISDISTHGY